MAELRTVVEIGLGGEDRIHGIDVDRAEKHVVLAKDNGAVIVYNLEEGKIEEDTATQIMMYDYPAQGALWFPPEYGMCVVSWDLNGSLFVHAKQEATETWGEVFSYKCSSIPLCVSLYNYSLRNLSIFVSTSDGCIIQFIRQRPLFNETGTSYSESFQSLTSKPLSAPSESISLTEKLIACAKRDGELELFNISMVVPKKSLGSVQFDKPLTCCSFDSTNCIAVGTVDGETYICSYKDDSTSSLTISEPKLVSTLLTSSNSSDRENAEIHSPVVGLSWSDLGTELTVDYADGSVAVYALD